MHYNRAMTLKDKSILLIITGGIAAYKSLELIRLLRKDGATVRAILTKAGEQFVTPLSVSALCEHECYTDLWSLKDESEMGHIRLSREADLIIIAPASADIIGKMAHGLANDLASTTLLASTTPIMVAPAMNVAMWNNAATQDNIATLSARGVSITGPEEGDMACGEFGMGRMSEPSNILKSVNSFFLPKPLAGKKAIVTSGPTFEPIDPVRFLGNRSSGKQGHAIAQALQNAGTDVTLITGPVSIPDPAGCKVVKIETAQEMLAACESVLPADIAVCAAAVSDWRAENAADQKLKKRGDASPPDLKLTENPDILKTISNHKNRPTLVVGFAAETEKLQEHAANKLQRKGCDWILANDVSVDEIGQSTFGAQENHIWFINSQTREDWGKRSKTACADLLVDKIIQRMNDK